MRLIKLDAPDFDGRLNPNAFLDWLVVMDDYFDWNGMPDSQHVRFAKMKLVSYEKHYWLTV